MNNIPLFPADIAQMSVSQLAALLPGQKHETHKHLDTTIDRLKFAAAHTVDSGKPSFTLSLDSE